MFTLIMAQLKLKLQIGHRQRWSTSKLWLITVLFLTTQSAMPVVGEWDCLRCEDFNREPNKQFRCAKRYGECGECISGFIQDPEDARLCFSLEILEESENVMKDRGSAVYLPCKFNSKIDCRWTKEGKEVTISHSYKWSYGNGVDTDDCSINFQSLSKNDIGTWVCSNRADSDVDSIHSKDIMVSITPNILVQPEPKYNVSVGESLTVKCIFDHPVKCSWMKDGRPVKSRTNYQFNEKETNTDCSLTIHSFNLNNDQGNWTCLKPANSEEEAIVSQTAQIHGYKSPKSSQYKAPITNEKEPTIYFGEFNVNRRRIDYVPGISVDSLQSVSCRVSNGAFRMSWLLHGESEHPGVRLGDTGISVDQNLETDIMSRLESEQEVELTCIVEYPDKESHSAIVTFVNVAPQSVQASSSLNSLFTVLIAVIIVMFCMVFAAIGFIIYYLLRRKAGKENQLIL